VPHVIECRANQKVRRKVVAQPALKIETVQGELDVFGVIKRILRGKPKCDDA
jgi:hypothetical protein